MLIVPHPHHPSSITSDSSFLRWHTTTPATAATTTTTTTSTTTSPQSHVTPSPFEVHSPTTMRQAGAGAGDTAAPAPALSPNASMETGSTTSDTFSSISVNSTYRHHQAGPFMPGTPASSGGRGGTASAAPPPQPTLVKDRQHKPKTLGSFGLLVVGMGGANGTTLLAGVLANRLKIDWRGPRGEPNSPNYYGCITQLDQRGKYGGVGYRNKVKGLADASMAAIGGWVGD